MSSGKVSAAFKKSIGVMPGYEEAKKAEANLSNVPVPLGWEGDCKVIDMVASVSESSGNPYVKFSVLPINDEKYGNKAIDKIYTIKEKSYQGATTTMDEVYAKFLNDMERAGLPREIRTGGEIDDIIAWWLNPDEDRIVHVRYDKIDKKDPNSIGYITLGRPKGGSVDNTDSLAPTLPSQKKTGIEVGTKVSYMDSECEVTAVDGDKLTVKTISGKTREINVKDLD